MSANRRVSNYERYRQAAFNRFEDYPQAAQPNPWRYQPLGAWVGRLILPTRAERAMVLGSWIELYYAPPEHQELVGQRVRLRWAQTPDHHARFWGATRNVHFSQEAHAAIAKGTVLAERLDGMVHVNPLESLAAAHAEDDIVVRLDGTVTVDTNPADGGTAIIYVPHEPTQITGRAYGLVRFVGSSGTGDGYLVQHYDRAAADFAGPQELVRLPEVVPDSAGVRPSTAAGIEHSPLNGDGWFIYGAVDAEGCFVVQSLAPRALLRLAPQVYCDRLSEAMAYLRPAAWKKDGGKGQATVALISGAGSSPQAARESWRAGDEALVIHLFGGIGGQNAEPAAKTPLYWGHFALGRAQVVLEPLSGELIFDIVYHQVYVHNTDGLTAGAMHYSRYSGDRQYGWAGLRPIQDILIKLEAITGHFTVFGERISALDQIVKQLEVMTARYRIADGRGSTMVGALNNCVQDSAQALYTAIRSVTNLVGARADIRAELSDTADEAERFAELGAIGDDLQRMLLPRGRARADWQYETAVLGSNHAGLLGSIGKAATSWRTMLPPITARALAEVLLKHGASAWVLRTYQIGGDDPTIAPYVPNV
ncbi:MAG: hypothetical protein H7Z42_23070 [Roseiflexaceae bacterium]|nr:hypothetical protein [Roseiflexaceae bacterium]